MSLGFTVVMVEEEEEVRKIKLENGRILYFFEMPAFTADIGRSIECDPFEPCTWSHFPRRVGRVGGKKLLEKVCGMARDF